MKNLHWDITKNCNLRCTHCYNADKYFNSESVDFSDTELTLKECLELVDKLHYEGFDSIHFLGGEPLASPNLFQTVERAKMYGMAVTINSNATLLTADVQRKLLSLGIDHFAASLDGATKETNDEIRGAGTFDKVCNNMRQFNALIKQTAAATQTAITTAITASNHHEAPEIPVLAAELGCNLVVFALFVEAGNGKKNLNTLQFDNLSTIIDNIELAVKAAQTNHIYLQLDMRPLFVEYVRAKYNANVVYNIANSLCAAGDTVWYLEADGNLHPCLLYRLEAGRQAQIKGTLKVQPIFFPSMRLHDAESTQYWQSFMKTKRSFKVSKIETCRNCSQMGVCSPCPFEYGNYQKNVEECECTHQRMDADIEELNPRILRLSENIKIADTIVSKNGVNLCTVNSTTMFILNKIELAPTFAHLCHLMKETYAADHAQICRDLLLTVFKLRNLGVITIV